MDIPPGFHERYSKYALNVQDAQLVYNIFFQRFINYMSTCKYERSGMRRAGIRSRFENLTDRFSTPYDLADKGKFRFATDISRILQHEIYVVANIPSLPCGQSLCAQSFVRLQYETGMSASELYDGLDNYRRSNILKNKKMSFRAFINYCSYEGYVSANLMCIPRGMEYICIIQSNNHFWLLKYKRIWTYGCTVMVKPWKMCESGTYKSGSAQCIYACLEYLFDGVVHYLHIMRRGCMGSIAPAQTSRQDF